MAGTGASIGQKLFLGHLRGLYSACGVLALLSGLAAPAAMADHDDDQPIFARDHAPIGVMGDHTHAPGEWMVSYRFMSMGMEGNLAGTEDISLLAIAQTTPNIFNTEFAIEGQPATVRVVPTEMRMDMHMFGAMYGLNDRVTLMGMVNYQTSEMEHVTYAGMVPADALTSANQIGTFTTRAEGFGDTTISALIDWYANDAVATHLTLGLSVPTGSVTETHDVLAPNGMTPTLRMPYPMQLGSGTFDPILGLTVVGDTGDTSYGVQTTALLRMYDNGEDYHLGDEYTVSVWAAQDISASMSASVRGTVTSTGKIDGRDGQIVAPVQTANPDLQGGERLDLSAGVNWAGQSGVLRGHRVAAEVALPVYQNLNGPQLETDMTVTIGWQYAF